MTKGANTTFKITSWDEKVYDESEEGPRLSRTSVKKSFAGDIDGTSTVEYVMMYRQNGTANFVGFERVVGSLFGRSGSFVLQHHGEFQDGTAKTNWFVVTGSGTGDLSGLRGEGSYAVGHAEEYPVTLSFDLE